MKQSYTQASASLIGKALTINGIHHTVTKFSPRTGKLKDGSTEAYVVVTSALGNEVDLHPRTVHGLFTKGESAGIKMLVDATVKASPKKAAAEVAPVEVAASKKAQAVAIFNEVVAAKGTRAEVIKRFQDEVGLSLNGANTYYQNCRGGKWE